MAKTTNIDSIIWLRHAWRNRLQSILLLFTMAGFLALLGWILWGADGLLMLMIMGMIGLLLTPSVSPAWIMQMYNAREIYPAQMPKLHHILSHLSQAANLPTIPAIYYVPSSMLNAFAVGSHQRSAIAITDGLLRALTTRELSGVLAHEISHIRNRDLWVMGLADLFSRSTSILSLFGQILLIINLPLIFFGLASINWIAIVILIFAPTLSALIQLALSRTREFDADLNAVSLTGDAKGLASALIKIEQAQGGWVERIFLPGRRIPEPSLLRTHPKTEQRVTRLLSLESNPGTLFEQEWQSSPNGVEQTFVKPIMRTPRWHINGLWH